MVMNKKDIVEEAKAALLGGNDECHYCRHRKEERCDPTMNYPGVFYLEFRPYCDIEQNMKHEDHCTFLWLGRDDIGS